ncbi:MAG: FKBP-type peptidyl-prolyl cis-trans isomerase [Phycisphaerales bacterium]|nr:FKBP-type peptidyl-prolyl cis-trans isomerase [Phycisphaerales bacterium]
MTRSAMLAACFGAALLVTSGALAQNETVNTQPADASRTLARSEWSSPAIKAVAERFVGSWRSTVPLAQAFDPIRREEAGPAVRVVMQVVPVNVPRTPDCLYLELAREDSLDRPYRQSIVQVFEVDGAVRIRTYEFSLSPKSKFMLAGFWASPEDFPRLDPSMLIATADLDVAGTAAGFVAKTRHPYPTRVSGAIEMTSEIRADGTTLTVLDRGFDATGAIVWGATSDAGIVFERFEHGVRIDRRPDGIVIIEWAHPEGTPVEPGDAIEWAYEAWVLENFDFIGSSDSLGVSAQWIHPGASTIRGWRVGGAQSTVGTNRTLIIPAASGFPEGMPEIGVPRGATLVYHIKCLSIIPKAELEEPEPDASTGEGAGESGEQPQPEAGPQPQGPSTPPAH